MYLSKDANKYNTIQKLIWENKRSKNDLEKNQKI